MVQLVIVIFSQGTPKRRACASLPDLIVMQSSPTDIWQSLICTLRQDSGFTPSVFGEGALSMVIPFMVTLSQNSGLTVQKGVPCENITITNCTMLSGHGGVVIGSEMSGSVRKVTFSNCVFDGTDRGIRIKSTRGRGGVVEDIRVSNVVMSNIKQEAVVLNLKYSKMPAEPKSERTPIFRNVHISGMTVTNVKTPIKIVGLEEAPISDIVLRDIHIQGGKQKCIFENCERITMDDVIVNGEVIKSTTDTTD